MRFIAENAVSLMALAVVCALLVFLLDRRRVWLMSVYRGGVIIADSEFRWVDRLSAMVAAAGCVLLVLAILGALWNVFTLMR